MADAKISALTSLGAAPATTDVLPLVDVSDTTMAGSGTDKKLLISDLFSAPGLTGAATHTGSITFSNGSVDSPGPFITDTRGDELGYAAVGGSLTPAKTVNIEAGTAAAPVTTKGGLLKMCKTEDLRVTDFVSGATNEQSACIVLHSKGAATSEVQTCPIYVVAENTSTQSANNDDAQGIGATGRITGSGTGRGIGGYLVGRRDTTTGTTCGAEIRSWNNTGTDLTYTATASSSGMGLWMSTSGPTAGRLCGCAIQIGKAPSSGQWDVGIGFSTITSESSVLTTCISDDSSAVTSIKINGSHTNGIDLSGGTFSGSPIIPPSRQTYTVTNGSTDRALNVTADTTAQVAAVLGTLIVDLRAIGLIA